MRSCNSPAVISGPIAICSARQIGPVSRPSSMRITMTAVSGSPAMIARWIGAAPRQRGSALPCRLRQPCARRGQDRLRQEQAIGDDDGDVGAVCARMPPAPPRPSGVRGVNTGMPAASAERCTGDLARLHAASGGSRRLRIDGCDLVAGRRDLGQRRHREIGRPHEDDAQHWNLPFRLTARIRREAYDVAFGLGLLAEAAHDDVALQAATGSR